MKLNNDKAIRKIAKELGVIAGSKSLPRVFPNLKSSYKGGQIIELLSGCKSKKQKQVVLQKIFSLHLDLSKTIIEEIEPSLNKLGFTLSNGVILENNNKTTKSLKNKAIKITKKYSKNSSLISETLIRKGEKLSEAYFAIYLIENHLRLFIWKLAGKSNRKLAKFLNKDDRKKINGRKKQESDNKWLSLRKDSNLFYLDIDDLAKLIQRNWSSFSGHFPDQNSIRTKIDEITLIRNRVAHSNSSITETEKKALELYMDQLFMQIK